jgi:hypothetical protein
MPLFAPDSLNPGVARREVIGWAMYDFANSGYTTVVLTAVFNAYFVGVVAGGAAWATLAWTLALGASNALVMLTMPMRSAPTPMRAAKKRVLLLSTLGCVAATVLLAEAGRATCGWPSRPWCCPTSATRRRVTHRRLPARTGAPRGPGRFRAGAGASATSAACSRSA